MIRVNAGEDDEALFPDPAGLTQYRMQQLQLVVDDYKRTRSSYPDSLRDLAANARQFVRENHRLDGWGVRMIYAHLDGRCVLRSAGPDVTPHTRDDLVRTWHCD